MHCRFLSILVLILCSSVVQSADIPEPPEVDARAHFLVDMHSGRVLSEAGADTRLEPASLAKMMTSYVVFAEMARGKFALSDEVLVSEKAWRMKGSRMFIEVGTRVSVEALLMGLIVQSGNDAAVALAEFVAGDEGTFAGLMNRYARQLGMTGSHFTNASGLPESDLYTTARDMAVIATALIRDFPQYYPWNAVREYEYGGIKQRNRNRLLFHDDSVDGLKTGYTRAARYCLVASAERDGMRLIAVVMGAESARARTRIAQSLLNYGFRFYETHRVYAPEEKVTDIRVWKGEDKRLALGLEESLYVTVPRGRYDEIDAQVEVATGLVAPVRAGEPQGVLRLALGDELSLERPLVALEDVAEGSLWQRVSDHVRLMFE
ncbi:MAG: D-alanyl-D-alanine carboxypeptidase [Thiotrichales bacterium]|nr:D-alanyl-D-alanine carboxypeptidase [Thiotrichales bacterium]MCY4351029.1 D-alanyl-D-alanine carboxypeptidase [Thiotrichales bacterium]